ncbi:MAG: hypothetical protein QOK03_896 [Candidatus Binataceae bacterium]|jgi:hypothetical protein|nr:hypothetical protein [Candidatus Binataceae bacterium]
MRFAGGMKYAFSEVSRRRGRKQPQLSLASASRIFVQPIHHCAQAGIDRAACGRIFSRRKVALRAVGIDWTSRRIDDRDRTGAELGHSIGKDIGQRRDAIRSADLSQRDACVAQFAALGRDRREVEKVFADVDSDERGVAFELEI